jgi:hypothetical protein
MSRKVNFPRLPNSLPLIHRAQMAALVVDRVPVEPREAHIDDQLFTMLSLDVSPALNVGGALACQYGSHIVANRSNLAVRKIESGPSMIATHFNTWN